jgi:hypothetical protein
LEASEVMFIVFGAIVLLICILNAHRWSEHGEFVVAVAAVVVVAAYTYYAREGVSEANLQARLMRENNIVSERAFVGGVQLNAIPALAAEDRKTKIVAIQLVLSNSGNTPTKNFTGLIRCVPSVEALSEPWALLHNGTAPEPVPNFIMPHGNAFMTCTFPADQMVQVQDGKLHAYVLADITYRDRVDPNASHRTEFEYEVATVTLDPDKGQWGGASLTPKGKHNCADEECPAD